MSIFTKCVKYGAGELYGFPMKRQGVWEEKKTSNLSVVKTGQESVRK